MTITTDLFLSGMKRLVTVPRNQNLMRDDDFLEIAQRKLIDTVLPAIDAINQEYFLWNTLESVIEGQSDYRIPTRAAGRKLRELKLVNSSQGEANLALVALERAHLYRQAGTPVGFYFNGDRITLVPEPQGSNLSLKYWWFLPPGKPIKTVNASPVVSVLDDDVTVSYVAPKVTVGSKVDFIQGTSGNACLKISKTVTARVGNVLSFATGDVPTDLAEGDWISPEGYSPVMQLPDIATYYLQTLSAQEVMLSLGDLDFFDRLDKVAKGQLEMLNKFLEPRIEGEPTVIINDYGLTGNRFGRNYWLFNY